MTEIDNHAVNAPQGSRVDREQRAAVVAALTNGLYLAAMPTFAVMAVLSWMSGRTVDVMCAAAHGGWPLAGMVPMYALMSAFHLGPWLKMIFRTSEAC